MNLYFENGWGTLKLLAENVQDGEQAWTIIKKFIDKCNKGRENPFKINYVRTWEECGALKYDVGSHSEFFLLKSDEEED